MTYLLFIVNILIINHFDGTYIDNYYLAYGLWFYVLDQYYNMIVQYIELVYNR